MAVTVHFFLATQTHLDGRFVWMTTAATIATGWHSFCANVRKKIKKLGYAERPIESLIESYDLLQMDSGGFESDSYVNPDGSVSQRRVRTWFYDYIESLKVETLEQALAHLDYLIDAHKTRWKDNHQHNGYNDDVLLPKHHPKISGLPWKKRNRKFYEAPTRPPFFLGTFTFNTVDELKDYLGLSKSTALKIIHLHGTPNTTKGTDLFLDAIKPSKTCGHNSNEHTQPKNENPAEENLVKENPAEENLVKENPAEENPYVQTILDALADLLPQGREIAEESFIDILEENKDNLTKEEYITCMGRGQDLLDEYFMEFQF